MEKPLTIKEAILYARECYGEDYHYNTFYQWLSKGKLKGFKRGGHWRVFKESLDNFFCPDCPTSSQTN